MLGSAVAVEMSGCTTVRQKGSLSTQVGQTFLPSASRSAGVGREVDCGVNIAAVGCLRVSGGEVEYLVLYHDLSLNKYAACTTNTKNPKRGP